jgi:hypothetical protein
MPASAILEQGRYLLQRYKFLDSLDFNDFVMKEG